MFFLYIVNIIGNDVEQINALDKVVLQDDDSTFITTPSAIARRNGVTGIERHRKKGRHCHDNHMSHNDHGYGSHSHCDKISDIKDSYGHYVFKKHFTHDENLSPTGDAYVPYLALHYPMFPFNGGYKYRSPPGKQDSNDDINFMENGLFH